VNTPRTFVDVHVLQTVPPSNLNRDDAGSPKQAMYGGARRARVSSQAWKRATRVAFERRLHLPQDQLGTRTKRIASLLAERIRLRTRLDEEASTRLSTTLLAGLEVTPSKKVAGETSYLLFFGEHQLDTIVDLIADRTQELVALDDEALKKAATGLDVRGKLTAGHPIDVALFGRMVADLPALNVEAATQVAHALSVCATEIEFDYYTAVDDAKPKEESLGAGMIGTVEFTSATLYRYATVGLHQLAANLDRANDAAVSALCAFIEAFVFSMPSGHQNTFAHHTLPHLVSVVVRDDQPVNLVSAYEKPVRATATQSISEQAVRLFADEMRTANTVWGVKPLLVSSVYDGKRSPAGIEEVLGEPLAFADMLAQIRETAATQLSETAAS
jgi:CRISPR system Cascade subunit CasC